MRLIGTPSKIGSVLKKQTNRVYEKIKKQVSIVFGKKGGKLRKNRELLESIWVDQNVFGPEFKERFMIVQTLQLSRLREIRRSCGDEALFDIISDGQE